ncbi:MAG: hypothetical protein ACI9XU_000819 [Arenicella sp.]|jgi:hypothetical protein
MTLIRDKLMSSDLIVTTENIVIASISGAF